MFFKDESDLYSREFGRLLWTDIGLKNLGQDLRHLMVTGAEPEENKTLLCVQLAQHLCRIKKNVLLLDLDHQGTQFKSVLHYEAQGGFSDLCYKLFEPSFFSYRVDDYGFCDLIHLLFLQQRTGQMILFFEDEDPVALEFVDGFPVEIRDSQLSLFHLLLRELATWSGRDESEITHEIRQHSENKKHHTQKILDLGWIGANELKIVYTRCLTQVLKNLASKSFLSFDFADKAQEDYEPVKEFVLEPFAFLKSPLSQKGLILRHIQKYTVNIKPGLNFMPSGHYHIKNGDFTKKHLPVLEILKQQYDFILVNAPAFSSDSVAKELGQSCDGTVLVLKSGALDRKKLNSLLAEIKKDDIPLIGAVLNEVTASPKL